MSTQNTPEPHDAVEPSGTAGIDWHLARHLLRRYVSLNLGAGGPSQLEHLVQEVCVRPLRATRREPPRDLEPLCATIARRTWQNFLKRRFQARAYFAEQDWAEVARRRGTFHAAVRKRCSFCVRPPRRAIAADFQLRRLVFREQLQEGAQQ